MRDDGVAARGDFQRYLHRILLRSLLHRSGRPPQPARRPGRRPVQSWTESWRSGTRRVDRRPCGRSAVFLRLRNMGENAPAYRQSCLRDRRRSQTVGPLGISHLRVEPDTRDLFSVQYDPGWPVSLFVANIGGALCSIWHRCCGGDSADLPAEAVVDRRQSGISGGPSGSGSPSFFGSSSSATICELRSTDEALRKRVLIFSRRADRQ